MNTIFIEMALAGLDWAISRAEAAGETIPQEHLDARTEFRREAVRLAGEESSEN